MGKEAGKWTILLVLLLLDVGCVHDGSVHDLRRESEGLPLHHSHRQQLEPERTVNMVTKRTTKVN